MNRFTVHSKLAGSVRAPLDGEDVSAVDGHALIDVTLQLRRRASLDALALANSGTVLSHQELESRFGASSEDVQLVEEFAEHFSLAVTSVERAKRLVRLRGTARALSDAFQVQLRLTEKNGKVFRTRTGSVHVPSELIDVVTGVFGLDNRPQARPHLCHNVSRPASLFKPNAFDGNQLASIYDFPASQGAGTAIALIELGGGYIDADIAAFFLALNLPKPEVVSVSVNGSTNSPLLDPNADTEVALDIEVAGAAAPQTRIIVLFAPNDDQGFLEAILAAIHDETNKPQIISISWGAAESAWTAQQLAAMNDAFQSAAALGISVFCAAGDDGANDNVSDGKAHVDFPASSPFVTACGGTSLTVANGTRHESAWNDGNGSATGGGISGFFARPDYQQNISIPSNLNGNFQGRGLPDVSAAGDPNTGYAVLVDGLWSIVGGTSAVAPLFAGLLARIDNLTGKSNGLINPVLYRANSGNGFNDIVDGNNSCDGVAGYTAVNGWDPVTGWGSPGGSSLLSLLQQQSAGLDQASSADL